MVRSCVPIVQVREEESKVAICEVNSCLSCVSGQYTYMVCGCKEHCIPSIEEAAKISSLVAPTVYLTKGQKYHIWYEPRCLRAKNTAAGSLNTTHDIDTTIELQRKHYTRHRRKCSSSDDYTTTTNNKNNNTIPIIRPTNTPTTSKLKKYHRRHSRFSSSRSRPRSSPRCLTSTAKSPTSFTGIRCLSSSLR